MLCVWCCGFVFFDALVLVGRQCQTTELLLAGLESAQRCRVHLKSRINTFIWLDVVSLVSRFEPRHLIFGKLSTSPIPKTGKSWYPGQLAYQPLPRQMWNSWMRKEESKKGCKGGNGGKAGKRARRVKGQVQLTRGNKNGRLGTPNSPP